MRAFGDDFRGGTGDSGKQPFEAPFPRDELDLPFLTVGNKFVVPFRDAQDFVHRLNPLPEYPLPVEKRMERRAHSRTEPLGFVQEGLRGLRIRAVEGKQFAPTFGCYDLRVLQKSNKVFQRPFGTGSGGVHEIERKASSDEPEGGFCIGRHNSFNLAYWLGPLDLFPYRGLSSNLFERAGILT